MLGSFMISDDYRANAKASAALAAVVHDLNAKVVLLNMAEAWLRLADYVERREQGQVGEHFRADNSPDKDLDLK